MKRSTSSTPDSESDQELIESIRRLHRAKDAAYGSAWKRRGEVMSIMANIARKVDRLEMLAAGGPITADESQIDTVVDLFVYCLKYQTYLADQHADVAKSLFNGAVTLEGTYSDGPQGFELLLSRFVPMQVELHRGALTKAMRDVVGEFAELEGCFGETVSPATLRMAVASRMINKTWHILTLLSFEHPDELTAFIRGPWNGEPDGAS